MINNSILKYEPDEDWRYTEWLGTVMEYLDIKYTDWGIPTEDFNKFFMPDARQVYYQSENGKNGLIRVNHPITWGELWQISDNLIHRCEQQGGFPRIKKIIGVEYDLKGTITVEIEIKI